MPQEARLGRGDVSVIVVNWNAGEWLERCIAALQAQTLPPLEIIVVDNASTDGSAEKIRNFQVVRLIDAGRNLGFAAANNLAVCLTSSESRWIALLNPDAFPAPTWLESLRVAAQRSPVYAMFGSRLMDAKMDSVVDGLGDVYHASGRVWREGHGKLIHESVLVSKEVFSPCAAAAMYRKDVFVEVGGFDEDFFCYLEDVDLGFRLRLLGYRCLFVPESVVRHVGSAITGSHSDFSVYCGHRNLVWTFLKNMPGILLWLLLPLHLLLNLWSIIYFAGRGQGKVILRAKRDAIMGIGRMWRKRRQVQANRRVRPSDIWRILDKHLLP